ncbi:MAG: phospho-sugar mutase [Polyangiaceae bacterium]
MSQSTFEELEALALEWLAGDPDESTAKRLREILASKDERALRACFEPPMEFGTAGLRGIVGPGPAQMNVAVIRRVTRALASVLDEQENVSRSAPVVLGFDGRLDSKAFAAESINVLASTGRPIAFFSEPVPTPVVAFAGLRCNAAASIVVTASHNPPEYNGYKVYGSEGIQIVPPFDSAVTTKLESVGKASDIPVEPRAFTSGAPGCERLDDGAVDAYVEAVLRGRVLAATAHPIRIAYTPLHGVGARCFERVMSRAGYDDVHIEPSQHKIDGHFPTVRFPNPEEPATLERGLALATAIGADVLLVNDPDADRMGAALPDERGRFRILSGNEIGVILTNYVLSRAVDPGRSLVVSTLVSTPMTRLVAEARGAHFEQTLTGFKWLWTAVRSLELEHGLQFAICWEEALGYSTHRAVRDKDGIAAALVFADWVSECRRRGELPLARLGELYRLHGAWGSSPANLVFSGPSGLSDIQGLLARLASRPPTHLLGRQVLRVTDYAEGAEKRPLYRGAAVMFVLELEGDARIVVRPSGTEPKLKIYSDVREVVVNEEDPFVAYERARAMARLLAEALIESLR